MVCSDLPVLCELHVVWEGVEFNEKFNGIQVSLATGPVQGCHTLEQYGALPTLPQLTGLLPRG